MQPMQEAMDQRRGDHTGDRQYREREATNASIRYARVWFALQIPTSSPSMTLRVRSSIRHLRRRRCRPRA
jgi:hypothetical protein